MVIVDQIEESQEELKSSRRILGNQKSNKNCIQKKKREKENLIKKISWFFFATDLTTKEEEFMHIAQILKGIGSIKKKKKRVIEYSAHSP